MHHIRLFHWNATEAKERVGQLQKAGYDVAYETLTPALLRRLKQHPPAAVVIDLTRAPAMGRDVGVAIRHYKTTRHVPLVFANGDPEKVARIKQQLPDAVYTTWKRIRSSLKQAISHPPVDPVAPASILAGYSGTPLPRKLGIKPDSVVALVGAPPDFEKTLGAMPQGVSLRKRASSQNDLIIWFTRSRKDLERRIERMAALVGREGMWIAWPKKGSPIASDLTQAEARKAGLAAGLVDYKVCAIDTTWSGLKFARRKV